MMLTIRDTIQRGPVPCDVGEENEIDERRLEIDPICRFAYAAQVIGLNDDDFAVLNQHFREVEPYMAGIVDRVYERMFQFPAMKRHFFPAHHGFYGHAPATMDDVRLDHPQTVFRKQKLLEYFVKLSTGAGDETFAVLLDVIARFHTPHQGNALLSVPIMQITALLGFMSDQFVELVAGLQIAESERLKLQRAYCKLFWVQNNLFVRHYVPH